MYVHKFKYMYMHIYIYIHALYVCSYLRHFHSCIPTQQQHHRTELLASSLKIANAASVLHALVFILPKEPYVSTKEPYASAKEP